MFSIQTIFTSTRIQFSAIVMTLYLSRRLPNPSSDTWTISTPNNMINSVEVFNVLGKKVISQNFNSDEASISVQSLASGIYLARLTTNAGVKTMKLIRE